VQGAQTPIHGVAGFAADDVWAVGSYSPLGADQPLIELNPAGVRSP
jgi:hypothetical protein